MDSSSSSTSPIKGEQQKAAACCKIDASFKGVLQLFFGFSILWLFLGSTLKAVASIQLYDPSFLAYCEYFSHGRISAVADALFSYGWMNNAAYAVGLWIMARLCQTSIKSFPLLYISGTLWNLAVLIGVIQIFAGNLSGFDGLMFSGSVSALLGTAYLFIGIWSIVAYLNRIEKRTYISQLFLLGAFLWFPWVFIVSQTMLQWSPASGVVQSIVHGWFLQNYLGLWLVPVALGAAYYIVPKVLERPVAMYSLSQFAFWTTALFFALSGGRYWIEGPVPAWLSTLAVVASFVLIGPAIMVACNFYGTIQGNMRAVWISPSLRFIIVGIFAFVAWILAVAITGTRGASELTQFTYVTDGLSAQATMAFFSMVMFGAIYYILPRVSCRTWTCACKIRLHWWLSVLGVTFVVSSLLWGGIFQGRVLLDENAAFIESVEATLPWLKLNSAGMILFALGQLVFFFHFMRTICPCRTCESSGSPTLLGELTMEEVEG